VKEGGCGRVKWVRLSNEGHDRWVLSMVWKVGGGRSWRGGT
jgi:hypothetical protein